MKIAFLQLLTLTLLTACAPAQPTPATPQVVSTCTLQGCADTLEVELRGNVPGDFYAEVTTSEGETARSHCVSSTNPEATPGSPPAHQPFCGVNALTFYGFHPDEFDLTLSWGEISITRHLQPSLEIIHPNGPACPPACELRRAVFELDE